MPVVIIFFFSWSAVLKQSHKHDFVSFRDELLLPCLSFKLDYIAISFKMDSLPTEILTDIFIQIPIIQKQKCMLVSKKWATFIRNHLLLHTVVVRPKDDVFKWFISMIKEHPHLGHQVINLNLNGCFTKDYSWMELFVTFPNLKVLKIGICTVNNLRFPRGSNEPKLTSFEGSISDLCLTRLILSSPLPYLVHLTLHFGYTDDIIYTTIVPTLKNATALKNLSLSKSSFTIDQFELLHSNTPLLESLDIWGAWFVPVSEFPTITLVTSLKTLTISHPNFQQKCGDQWLYYFDKKYPKLEKSDFLILYKDFKDVSTMVKCMQDYPNIFREHRLDMIGCPDDDCKSIINLADEYEYKIKELSLDQQSLGIRHLIESKQSKFIDNLIIQGRKVDAFDWLNKFTSLNSIVLNNRARNPDADDDYTIWNIDLSIICRSCPPALQSITVSGAILQPIPACDQQYPSIKKLDILRHPKPFEHICHFISTCLPNLDKLCLDLRRYSNDQSPTFLFPNHHFSVIELSLQRIPFVTVKLVASEKTRFYCLNYHSTDYTLLGDVMPVVPEPQGGKYFTIVCASTKALTINDISVYL
jgi:hypothetical protein